MASEESFIICVWIQTPGQVCVQLRVEVGNHRTDDFTLTKFGKLEEQDIFDSSYSVCEQQSIYLQGSQSPQDCRITEKKSLEFVISRLQLCEHSLRIILPLNMSQPCPVVLTKTPKDVLAYVRIILIEPRVENIHFLCQCDGSVHEAGECTLHHHIVFYVVPLRKYAEN